MAEPHAFRRAAENKDLDLMRECLREDIVLHSPILFRGFEGRDAAIHILSHVTEAFEDFAYLDEVVEGRTVILRFRANIGRRELEGIDYLELDSGGLVRELTVFMRPLSAVTAFNERMKARLEGVPQT